MLGTFPFTLPHELASCSTDSSREDFGPALVVGSGARALLAKVAGRSACVRLAMALERPGQRVTGRKSGKDAAPDLRPLSFPAAFSAATAAVAWFCGCGAIPVAIAVVAR